jgi:uncharacterized Tic20 family protein
MESSNLSGGAKAGYFALGFFLAVIGILIAWLVNKDKPVMKEAIKFSVIGCVVGVVLWCILYVGVFAAVLGAGALGY